MAPFLIYSSRHKRFFFFLKVIFFFSSSAVRDELKSKYTITRIFSNYIVFNLFLVALLNLNFWLFFFFHVI